MDDKSRSEIAEMCNIKKRKFEGTNLVEGPEYSENKKYKSTEEIESNRWAELPHLALTKIFSFLNRKDGLNASTTCRHWRSTYFQPRFWDSLKIFFLPDKLDSASFLSGVFGATIEKVGVLLNFPSKSCLKECIEFLNQLQFNNNLRTLYIGPVLYGGKSPSEQMSVPDPTWHMRTALVDQLTNCLSNLDDFSIGYTPELFPCSINYLLENLNLSVKKIYLYHYRIARYRSGVIFNPDLLRRFTKLQLLSIHWTQLSPVLFEVLFEAKSLKRVIIFVEPDCCCHFAVSEFEKLEEQGVVVEAVRFVFKSKIRAKS